MTIHCARKWPKLSPDDFPAPDAITTLNFSCLGDYYPESLTGDRARDIMLDMLPAVTGYERVFIRQALGRVLAEDVISPVDVPAHDNSAMDGWALRSADLDVASETRLRNIGTAFAGHAFDGTVGRGEAVRIMTGAVYDSNRYTLCSGAASAEADSRMASVVVMALSRRFTVPPGGTSDSHIIPAPGRRTTMTDFSRIAVRCPERPAG
jgi:hypothetical protein